MSAELTTVLVALLGVLGTLLSPILAQQIASRAKRLNFTCSVSGKLTGARQAYRDLYSDAHMVSVWLQA